MKIILKIAAAIIFSVYLVLAPVFLGRAFNARSAERTPKVVLEMWHVDSFEGGTGSRKDFLDRSAAAFEKENEGVLISVINHTAESVKANFDRGIRPDLISFGVGVTDVLKYAKPLKTRRNGVFFDSGAEGDAAFFYPYAFGNYYIFTNAASKGKGAVLSVGKNNFPKFAAKLAGKNYSDALSPLEAFATFAGGAYGELIGTQRDVYRLARRGVEFEVKPLGTFTDLVQYVAVTAEGENAASSEKFAEYLVSDEVQGRLFEIGLFSPTGAKVNYGEPHMDKLKNDPPTAVLAAGLSGEEYGAIKGADGLDDIFEKFKKYIGQ